MSSGSPTTSSSKSRGELRAARVSLIVSVGLTGIKFFAYVLTRSNAIFSDALENVVNVVTAMFALYALTLAHRPADKDHPYGHGKIEFFSAGLEGAMILLAGFVILCKVTASLGAGVHPPRQLTLGLIVMAGALMVNGGLGIYLFRSGKRSGAITLEASGTHLWSDAIDSVVVLLALAIVRWTGWAWVDAAAACLVAAYLGWLGIGLMKRSTAGLMDALDMSDDALLKGILDGHVGENAKQPRICSYHKLRHRHSGRYHWVEFHLVVPRWWDVQMGHRVATVIEMEIEAALGEGNATAHIEPCTTTDCAHCKTDQVRA